MNYQWRQATGADVNACVTMAQQHFESEIDQIFKPDPLVYERNLMRAIVEQFYVPGSELVQVCSEQVSGDLVAYVWAHRSRAPWSDDDMCAVRMAHVDMTLGTRNRVRLIVQMIAIWEQWALDHHIPVICSTTMRGDQQAFLRIHQRCGYDVRGSFAYKRCSG